ncbi:hypothetical protein FYJ85_11250 [Victivallaceae bacterium BBE-744-WT-12]|uniref:Uncharacterized protein n=1 Tax=Victivallis lenta TaxID=2606640 RepID=A0A844G3R9_9BACT|nr:hypothetical protein [Victivallis lenta]MST97614.1 hypothetical protein [Victivallis lenta]
MAGESKVVIVGLTEGPVWGCPDLSWGKGQSLDVDHNGDSKTMEDGQGQTVAKAYYNNKETVSYTVKVAGQVPGLKRGNVLQVDGKPYILDSWKDGKKSGDFQEYTLNLESFESITVTAGA